ncbi:MAG: transporter substrate-binding domain-containing protein [Rhizobiaceae bacterium]|nr:transporter substrate-binding domain-containing protein [Rhizobiaceae bacterium]
MGTTAGIAQVPSAAVNIPNFRDPNVRLVKPEGMNITRLRFLTTTDFPPFNFIDRDKLLSGFHVELARQICNELEILGLCQIQAVPWNELDQAMESGEGEAIIAGLEMSYETKKKYDFSLPFLQIPARFTALRGSDLAEPMARSLFKKKTALVKGSAHARYFKAVFEGRKYIEYESLAEAKKALQDKTVDTLFTDAVSLVFWLPSNAAGNCCKLVGGPYISREYFGNGLSVAVTRGNPKLVDAINFALGRINDNGKFGELYLRYFPLGLF